MSIFPPEELYLSRFACAELARWFGNGVNRVGIPVSKAVLAASFFMVHLHADIRPRKIPWYINPLDWTTYLYQSYGSLGLLSLKTQHSYLLLHLHWRHALYRLGSTTLIFNTSLRTTPSHVYSFQREYRYQILPIGCQTWYVFYVFNYWYMMPSWH